MFFSRRVPSSSGKSRQGENNLLSSPDSPLARMWDQPKGGGRRAEKSNWRRGSNSLSHLTYPTKKSRTELSLILKEKREEPGTGNWHARATLVFWTVLCQGQAGKIGNAPFSPPLSSSKMHFVTNLHPRTPRANFVRTSMQEAEGGGRRGQTLSLLQAAAILCPVMREVKEEHVYKLSGIGRRGRGRAGAKLQRYISSTNY